MNTIRIVILWALAGGVCGPVGARNWTAPVMATWTDDPRTTVTLAWERPAAATAQVTYGVGEPADDSRRPAFQTVAFTNAVPRHVVTLRDLTPGTHYRYTVSSSDGYEATGRWWTAPASPEQPFSFVLLNDLQGGLNADAAKAVAAGVVAAQPTFVLSAGDLADSRHAHDYAGVIRSWQLMYECLEDVFAAGVFQPVAGNHDEPENPDSFWYRLLELPGDQRDYVFDVGPIRFIMVDATKNEAASRMAWLARELQQAAYDPAVTWVIPTFHRPPYSWGERGGDEDIRQWWTPLFTRYEVGLVISGHAHTYQRTRPIEGVPYLVSGGSGGWLYAVDEQQPEIAFATSVYHFVEFRVEAERLGLEAKGADGTVFDRASYVARHHVQVEPVFPVRGENCTIRYDARGGPLADAGQIHLHLGRDDFTEALLDVPMKRDAAGVWTATFVVPESPKWHLAFCFHDPQRERWHNNYTYNWQALVAREW